MSARVLVGWRGVLMLVVAACVIAPVRSVQADLVVTGTRFIYPAGQKALTLRTGNVGQHPILVQSWLDSGDFTADPSRETVPFLLTPPVFRLDPAGRMSLLLRHTGEAMPKERESVFWINFLEVPARDSSQKNLLQLAYRLRMKVLYRPEGLPGSASEAIGKVAWTYHAADGDIEAHNETPYFVSLARVELEAVAAAGGGHSATPITLTGLTVAPLARTRFLLPAGAAPRLGVAALRYYAANDDGEIIEAKAALRQGKTRGTQ